jgi:hypothetical protein
MAMQSAQLHFIGSSQPAPSSTHSERPGITAPILVASCLLVAMIGLWLVGQPGAAASRAPDATGAWIVGP